MSHISGAAPQTKQEFIEICGDMNITPLKVRIHRGIIYGIFREEDVMTMLHMWEAHEYVPPILGMTIGPMKIYAAGVEYQTACYTVFENETGDFYMEDCVQMGTALRWLTGEADSLDIYHANQRIIKHLESNPRHIIPWKEADE